MAKPKTSDRSDLFMDYVKYTWEFLRRNREYIDQWNALYEDPTPKHDAKNVYYHDLNDDEVDFCAYWQIHHPLSPEISYDAFLNDTEVEPSIMFLGLMYDFSEEPILIMDGRNRRPNKNIDSATKHEMAKTGQLNLEIDLSCSKGALLEKFEALLDEWNEIYKSTLDGKSSGVRKKRLKKFNTDVYDTYLKVYDLKKTMSWAKIARVLKLKSPQTARNYYKAADELIKKGISLYVE